MTKLEQMLRYGVVGLANTAIGYGTILAGLAVGMGDYAANAVGFAVGLCFSYFANRRFTFDLRSSPTSAEIAQFAGCFVLAYSANLLVVMCGRAAGLTNNPAVHLVGTAVYSLLFFVLIRSFAFRIDRSDRQDRSNGTLASWRSLTRSHWPELILGALAIGTLPIICNAEPPHDISWQFWIARQLNSGQVLYRDIWEVNPPLWFWSAVPVERLAELMGTSPYPIWNAIVIAWCLASALAFGHLGNFANSRDRAIAMVAAFWFCGPYQFVDFGQREQFALIAALPYIALVVARREGQRVPVLLAVSIGLGAAYGIALKHYFLAVPALLEAWLAYGRRWRWPLLRPETLVIGIFGFAYALTIFRFAPDFFTTVVPMVKASYSGYEVSLAKQFDEPSQWIWIMVLIALWRGKWTFSDSERPLAQALLVAAAGFAFAYFAQQKGWQYHAHPVTALLVIVLILQIKVPQPEWITKHAIAIFALTFAVSTGLGNGSYYNFLRMRSEPFLQSAAPGSAVAVLAADPMYAWPIVDENRWNWPLHFYSLWMIPAIAGAEKSGTLSPELAAVGDRVRKQTLIDLRCSMPDVILFERRPSYDAQPISFNLYAYFARDPEFATLLNTHYAPGQSNKWIQAFVRRGPASTISDPSCLNSTLPPYPLKQYDKHGNVIDQPHDN